MVSSEPLYDTFWHFTASFSAHVKCQIYVHLNSQASLEFVFDLNEKQYDVVTSNLSKVSNIVATCMKL